MKQAALMLVLTAVSGATPACDSDVKSGPSAVSAPEASSPAAAPAAPGLVAAPAPISAPVTEAATDPGVATPSGAASPFPADVVLTMGPAWIAPAGRSPLGGPGESTPTPALRLGEVATVKPAPAVRPRR